MYISSALISSRTVSVKPTFHMTAAAAFSENPVAAGLHTLITPHDRSEIHVSTQRDVPRGLHPHQWVITLIQPDFTSRTESERERERRSNRTLSLMFHFQTKVSVSSLDVIMWTHNNVSSYSMLTGHHGGRHSLWLFSLFLLLNEKPVENETHIPMRITWAELLNWTREKRFTDAWSSCQNGWRLHELDTEWLAVAVVCAVAG